MQSTLTPVRKAVGNVVAQIIETEFIVGAISHVGGISLAPGHHTHVVAVLLRGLMLGIKQKGHLRVVGTPGVLQNADLHAEQVEDWPHPFSIAARQVIVDRHQMRAPAGECVQIERQGGHQRFTLASAHFRDAAGVQHLPANQLHRIMAQTDGADCSLPHRGERRHQNLIKRMCLGLLSGVIIAQAGGGSAQLLAEGVGFRAQLRIAQGLIFRFKGGDFIRDQFILLQVALSRFSTNCCQELLEHATVLLVKHLPHAATLVSAQNDFCQQRGNGEHGHIGEFLFRGNLNSVGGHNGFEISVLETFGRRVGEHGVYEG